MVFKKFHRIRFFKMKFSNSWIYIFSSRLIISFCLIFVNVLNQVTYASSKIDLQNSLKESSVLQKDLYLLGPGDILNLNVIDAPELSVGRLEIFPDGTISVSLIGSIFVNNLSIDEAKQLIQKRLSDHLLVPEVQLSVIKFKPIRVTLIGEIQRPGIYVFNNESEKVQKSFATVVDAIVKAGGLTNKSNIEKVKLIRNVKSKSIEKKQAELNLWELINKGNQENNPILFDGDTIVFDRNNVTSKESSEFAFANLTPDFITVKVLGAVKTPGLIELPVNTPLSQAVYSVGGPLDYLADSSRVYLIRLNRDGTVDSKKYKLNRSASTSDKFNPPLKTNDVIYVNNSAFSKATGALATVASPLTNVVTILSFLKLID